MIITGQTKKGFKFKADTKRLHNMSVIRKFSKLNEDSSLLESLEVYEAILGAEQIDALSDFCDDVAEKNDVGADEIFVEEANEILEKMREADVDSKN